MNVADQDQDENDVDSLELGLDRQWLLQILDQKVEFADSKELHQAEDAHDIHHGLALRTPIDGSRINDRGQQQGQCRNEIREEARLDVVLGDEFRLAYGLAI